MHASVGLDARKRTCILSLSEVPPARQSFVGGASSDRPAIVSDKGLLKPTGKILHRRSNVSPNDAPLVLLLLAFASPAAAHGEVRESYYPVL